jgi:DNA repair exonuclease SbcCD ATPase subunit
MNNKLTAFWNEFQQFRRMRRFTIQLHTEQLADINKRLANTLELANSNAEVAGTLRRKLQDCEAYCTYYLARIKALEKQIAELTANNTTCGREIAACQNKLQIQAERIRNYEKITKGKDKQIAALHKRISEHNCFKTIFTPRNTNVKGK